jgi:hypothetical protein
MAEQELTARREAAEAKLAELESRRAERTAKREAERAAEDAERALREAEAIEQAECEYGQLDEEIKVVRTPRGIVIVKRPATVALQQFHDASKTNLQAKDKFGSPYVVFPARDEYNRIRAEYGAAVISAVADAAAWLGGWGRTKLEGKSES